MGRPSLLAAPWLDRLPAPTQRREAVLEVLCALLLPWRWTGARERGSLHSSARIVHTLLLSLLGKKIKVFLACALWTQFVDTSVSLFSPPNHKPQTWFHELTHGTGRHRDDRPYVVTRPNPTLSVQPRTPFPSLHRPQRTTRSGRPGLAILGFHFAERPSLGPRKFSLGREGGGHTALRSCCPRYLHPSAPR